jgi:tight adherence protein C
VPFDPLAFAIAAIAIGGITALVAALRALASRRGGALAERLAEPSAASFGADPFPTMIQSAEPGANWLTRLLESITRFARPMGDEATRLQLRLEQAGIRHPQTLTIFLFAKMVLALVLLSAFLFVNSRRTERIEPAFVVAVLAFAIGFYLPDLWLRSRIESRQFTLERGLPDALDLLVTCVEAGLGLDAAVQRVADEIRLAWPQLAAELQVTFLEVKAGLPRVEAFRRLAARTGVKDLKSLAATLTQTEIFGTSVATALRVQADGMRVRRMHRAEERAAYVSVKMTIPLILCILPSLIAIIMGPAAVSIVRNLLPALGGGQ